MGFRQKDGKFASEKRESSSEKRESSRQKKRESSPEKIKSSSEMDFHKAACSCGAVFCTVFILDLEWIGLIIFLHRLHIKGDAKLLKWSIYIRSWTFSYDKLPTEPIRLSVLKLHYGSSVSKKCTIIRLSLLFVYSSATLGDLKLAIETRPQDLMVKRVPGAFLLMFSWSEVSH
ncbi:hypothetical protein Rs2_42610 [Raphanus sativus]|nr:hypothetical protein Rs2_42610 [Raphanus sativus]